MREEERFVRYLGRFSHDGEMKRVCKVFRDISMLKDKFGEIFSERGRAFCEIFSERVQVIAITFIQHVG